MHKLKPMTALGASAAQRLQFAGLTITEREDQALASLSARLGQVEACNQAARAVFGADLPAPGQGVPGTSFGIFWMGPDQWMVTAPLERHEDLAAEVKRAVGTAGSVTEQTGGWCRFDLKGNRLGAVLERLCNVDFENMAQGAVTRSRLEHLGCFVWCLTPGNEVAILGPRSSAGSLHHALVTAAKSAL